MLNLFEKHEIELIELAKEYTSLGLEKALSLSHIDLCKETKFSDPLAWRRFVTDPRVVDFINEEMTLIRQAKYRQMTVNIEDVARSTGASQIMRELRDAGQKDDTAKGPIFVYCYIPLNEEELGADNIEIIKEDPFKTTI